MTCQEYGKRYTLLGPLSYKSAPMEVEAIDWETTFAGPSTSCPAALPISRGSARSEYDRQGPA